MASPLSGWAVVFTRSNVPRSVCERSLHAVLERLVECRAQTRWPALIMSLDFATSGRLEYQGKAMTLVQTESIPCSEFHNVPFTCTDFGSGCGVCSGRGRGAGTLAMNESWARLLVARCSLLSSDSRCV